MVTGERGQRAAAMMVGEVDRRETADAVKRFRMELRDAAESHERWGTVFGTGVPPRERVGSTPKTASKAVVFGGLPTDTQLLSVLSRTIWALVSSESLRLIFSKSFGGRAGSKPALIWPKGGGSPSFTLLPHCNFQGANMRMIVEPYQSRWADDYASIRTELNSALEGIEIVGIEHVGSTSVVGLAARPILDIDIIVTRATVPAAIAAVRDRAGYEYMGEWGIEDRHAFKLSGVKPARNLYVCVEDCAALRNHLGVRDVLRSDPELREEYAAVKKKLAEQEHERTQDYVAGKTEILQRVLEKAGIGCEERESIGRANSKTADWGVKR